MEELGIDPDDIGSHSCRKGSSSDVMSGSTAGPSIVAVAHRAGWVLSKVFNIYLKMEAAGDHYVGRLAAGLDINSPKFATLPYHFCVDNDAVRHAASLCFPSLWNLAQFRGVLRMCLAALVGNKDFLNRILPGHHPLFLTPLFRSSVLLESLPPLANEHPRLKPTGIPPHIGIQIMLEKTKEEMSKSVRDLQGTMCDEIRSVLREEGAAGANLTPELLRSVLSDELKTTMQSLYPNLENRLAALEVETPSRCSPDAVPDGFNFTWEDRPRRVPKDFKFPTVTLRVAWSLWWLGSRRGEMEIPPFRFLHSADLPSTNVKKKWSDWKAVLKPMLQKLESDHPTYPSAQPTEEEVERMFHLVVDTVPNPEQGSYTKRVAEHKISTISNYARKRVRAESSTQNAKRRRVVHGKKN